MIPETNNEENLLLDVDENVNKMTDGPVIGCHIYSNPERKYTSRTINY